MGTMLITGLVLGTFAAFIEIRLGLGTEFMRRLIAKSALIGVAFSVALSMLIGGIFGAAGVSVMVIAMVCMAFTQPIYMMYNKLQKVGKDFSDVYRDIKNAFAPFVNLFKFGFMLIALPFKIIYKIVAFFTNTNTNRVPA